MLLHGKDPQTFVQPFPTLHSFRNTYADAIHGPDADKVERLISTDHLLLPADGPTANNPGHEEAVNDKELLPQHACVRSGAKAQGRLASGRWAGN